MVRAVKGSGSRGGRHARSTFDPHDFGFVHHPTLGGPVAPPDVSRIDELLSLRGGDLRGKFDVIDAVKIDELALLALKDKPDAQRAFLRVVRECVSPDAPQLSFRQFIDNSLLLPDEVFSTLAPSMLSALSKYPTEVSQPEVDSLMDHPGAVKPLLRLKHLMRFRPNHRFSEMMESAMQLPEEAFNENAPAIRRHLRHYAIEIPDRTRRILNEQPGQLRPYLMLRHDLGLTSQLPNLPELAWKILDGASETGFPDKADTIKILLSGCNKNELGDQSLSFLWKYKPDQLRGYLEMKANRPHKA